MTRDRIAELKELKSILHAFADDADLPRILLLTDDFSLSIRGNEAGLIRLAIELLEVSAGGQLSAGANEWLDSAGCL